MSYLDRINAANRHASDLFRPFIVCGHRVGFVHHDFARQLQRWPKVFRVQDAAVLLADRLHATSATVQDRTNAVHEVILTLREEGQLGEHWWNEYYAVNRFFGDPAYLQLERAALQLFGITGYGVHMNGFVASDDGLKMWIARRSRYKATGPGKLDQMVAGGQPDGIGLKKNMIKECAEEAAIPAAIAQQVKPVSAVSYCLQAQYGLRPDILYIFDLQLSPDFLPHNADQEVEEFYLWPLDQVIQLVHDTDEFKFNCALVVIDFLIRHGYIDQEDPDYIALINGLRYREQALSNF